MYIIKKYSYDQAKKLKVDIRPSNFKNKKIDVFKDDVFICAIGDIRYKDYPSYLELIKKWQKNVGCFTTNAIRKIILKILKVIMH